ncbi:hypothetical protein KGF56_001390 [Candida oxycetoniae]|uniref:Cytochrome c oxidase subunit 13, mitochondrial n=1 Tax=Candida oxycetoniae TaxID=497107 RepID=A0AAI9WZ38_9ASCO|nr:uncharacterized protein KGF56_001390 [Candida oxycetoniae]KAI3405783.2 hypothetical protein KGF56_001390 [Candida oxycetoniae]
MKRNAKRTLDAAPLDAAPLDAAPLDAAPLDAAPLDAVPLDAAQLARFTPYLLRYILPSKTSATTLSKIKQSREFDSSFHHYIKEKITNSGNGDGDKISIDKAKEILQEIENLKANGGNGLDNIINIPQREEIPDFHQYDPNFTFGLLLKYINENSFTDLEIPVFHWSDYCDMSVLNEYFYKLEKDKCKQFTVIKKDKKKDDSLDPKAYCINDFELDSILSTPQSRPQNHDPFFISRVQSLNDSLQFKQDQLSTGFHIFGFSGRNTKKLRPIIAKSYLYDFMKSPLSLTLLLPENKSMQINVNQQERKKLHNSVLFQSGQINVREEIEKLSRKLEPDFITLPNEKHLDQTQFSDSTVEKISQLEKIKNKLNQTDLNYLNSLKASITCENPPKYFREANIVKSEPNFFVGGHYDWRFINDIINGSEQHVLSINGLVTAFLKFTNQYGLSAWVAHGSLLSWYWNGMQFPWDGDVDVQMPIEDLHKLSRLFNQTIVVDFGNDLDQEIRFGRYFLDSSTFISHRVRGNGRNNIDARFIDMNTGFYVDITGLALSDTKAPIRYDHLVKGTRWDRDRNKKLEKKMSEFERNTFLQVYNCRNFHFARFDELNPLRLSLVEGEYGYIPSKFEDMVRIEYKEKSLTDTSYKRHIFIPKLRLWVLKDPMADFIFKGNVSEKKKYAQKQIPLEVNLTDEEYYEFLFKEKPIMKEFLITQNVTNLHQEELYRIFQQAKPSSFFVDNELGTNLNKRRNLRHDFFTNYVKESNYRFTFRRFASHYAPSKFLNSPAYKPNPEKGAKFIKAYEEKVHHSESITNLWKKMTYLVAIPAILLVSIPVAKVEMSHAEHRKHQRHLSDDEWPTQYEYQNIRSKPFFWGDGDKTLFWNSDVNRHVQKS